MTSRTAAFERCSSFRVIAFQTRAGFDRERTYAVPGSAGFDRTNGCMPVPIGCSRVGLVLASPNLT